ARLTSDFAVVDDPRGEPYTLTLDQPLPLLQGQALYLRLLTSGGVLTFSGSAVANETDYDYGLPFRVAGYDGFGGIYRGDLNLQVYWDDNADKLARFQSALDQADFIFIPTNHQYGQITRLPERYPLTTAYYRALLGCPQGQDIIACYRQAEPGMYQGELGFELAATFESYPSLGSWTINDQSAEEAFTFYDHPKVLIFRKTADYDPACVQAILGSVDLAGVIHMLPGQADDYKSLTLPLDRLAVQQAGGTWSQLFDYDWLQNRYPLLGLLLWYAFLLALGWAVYPLLRIALPGLADRGYPFARLAGMLLLAYLPWLAGSFEIPYSRLTIGIVFGLILLAGAGLAYTQRAELRREFKEKGVYFLVLEGFFLALLVIDLLIRIGNPDLWHPAKGGERPMNFSYFNAVLRSVTFPPYDPWFAGGYINYYYYGYVIVGTPVKLLGIVPSIAYNFILPTLFAMVGAGAFSIGYNLLYRRQPGANGSSSRPAAWLPLLGGMAASAGMVLLGNLGILRMYIWGAQRLIVPDSAAIARGNFLERTLWAIQGMIKSVMGEKLPYGAGDWYWFPSRVIPAPGDVEPITEFPLFTFLYSDLHAHMMALPLTLLVIACALSFVLALRHASHRPVRELVPALVFAALVIGALKPTNTWDLYAYLPLGALALGYALWRYWPVDGPRWGLPPGLLRPLYALLGMTVLVGLSLLLYQPFSHWFAQGYSEIDNWKGSHTPLTSYLAHWGLFLFVIVSWLAWETRQWMASTPASALGRLRPYQFWIEIGLVLLVAAALALGIMGIRIVWLALPLAAWSGILVLRPGQDEMKRAVLFLVGTALALTLVVELIVLSGDIGRMNTVFKLYYQAWTLLSISAAAAFGWLLPEFRRWTEGWRTFWLAAGGALLAIALLFTFLATSDKMRDRWVPGIPHTLDSLDYMQYASYGNYGVTMELAEDYRAIHWLQENVIGSPVIVEAAPAGVQYGWHSRMTIYTGLPGVIGWEWHQIQQRVLDSNAVRARGQEVDQFFNTTDLSLAQDFLAKYSVRYIIVGRLEWAKYTPTTEDTANGLLKFEAYEGRLWQEVYRDGQTVIYEVIPADEEAVP
ncbi:MAG: hypothetical protein FJZ96_07790, partial [Chloroflexi bacterium]|nr:hypothetical protein [Chloroflexota bacterium]